MKKLMNEFSAEIRIIGINPYVFLPEPILTELLRKNGKDKGPVPVKGRINNRPFQQTLVKYKGEWRLYVNALMLTNSPKRIGETISVEIDFDPSDRTITPHPKLLEALKGHQEAKSKFDSLTPSLQKEIIRYISYLKSDESIERNVNRAIQFLLGNESFIGRKPLE